MTFSQVIQLLKALDTSTQAFIWKITKNAVAVPPWDADAMAEEALRAFEASDRAGSCTVSFSGVYRLLEVIGVDLYRFLHTLIYKDCEGELDSFLPGPAPAAAPDHGAAARGPGAAEAEGALASYPRLSPPAESDADVWEAVCRAVGARGGERPEADEPAAACRACAALESALRRLADPSPAKLERWGGHELANSFLQRSALQYVPGAGGGMSFRDVAKLLKDLGLSSSDFVSRVTGGALAPPASDADAMARRVFQRFDSGGAKGAGALRFRDVYRLLEAAGVDLRAFLLTLSGGEIDDTVDQQDLGGGETVAGYRIVRPIGSGLGGAFVYLAEPREGRGARAALKWPLPEGEWRALQAVHQRAPRIVGLPALLASGRHRGQPFAVTELLGAELVEVFERLREQPLPRRWHAVRVLGRLLLRRLHSLHICGFVHCDVSPYNVLLGPARLRGPGAAELAPYLIDLGQARPHPGSEPLRGDRPSLEFSSVRSAEGGVPAPADDAEALGWSMVYGLFERLPWFGLLEDHYRLSDSSKERQVEPLVQVVREAKLELLEQGWGALGPGWEHLAQVPRELDAFLRVCQAAAPPAPLDYACLFGLLGGSGDLEAEDSELLDLQHFHTDVTPLL